MKIIIGALLFLGILNVFCGYQIKYKRRVEFIRGFDENKVIDRMGYIRWVGNRMLLIGVTSIITALLMIASGNQLLFIGIYFVFLVLYLIILSRGKNRYYKD
jgi:DNA-directed RNA polymerase subunit N (RpoN/RPB10)